MRQVFLKWSSMRNNWVELYARRRVEPYVYRSSVVQSRVFREWKEYVTRRRIKKKGAKEERRKLIIREAAVELLRVSLGN
jgi:hypothetical protein